ncbi:MAG TPA: hypothetical protein VHL58_10975 [Thermoanaerobaculia bacterium]|nr:hypothetical protein [Thermoanaerobaculia bacterium]
MRRLIVLLLIATGCSSTSMTPTAAPHDGADEARNSEIAFAFADRDKAAFGRFIA